MQLWIRPLCHLCLNMICCLCLHLCVSVSISSRTDLRLGICWTSCWYLGFHVKNCARSSSSHLGLSVLQLCWHYLGFWIFYFYYVFDYFWEFRSLSISIDCWNSSGSHLCFYLFNNLGVMSLCLCIGSMPWCHLDTLRLL